MGQKLVENAGAVIPAPVLEYVTPNQARLWLNTYNTQNRVMRGRWVASLSEEILSGRWMVTGDPIRFDETGELIDGQHRLAAIVRADTAVPVFVIRGLPVGVRDVIDTGVARLASDTMKFAGLKNTANVAAAAKIGVMRDLGYLRSAHDARSLKVTNAALLEWVQAHPTISGVIDRSASAGRRVGARSTSAWSYELWVYQNVDPVAAAEFESAIVEARTDGPGDPRFTLLRFFQAGGAASRIRSRNTPVSETIFVMRRTWNAWRQGEKLDRLMTMSKSGTAGVEIPDPV